LSIFKGKWGLLRGPPYLGPWVACFVFGNEDGEKVFEQFTKKYFCWFEKYFNKCIR